MRKLKIILRMIYQLPLRIFSKISFFALIVNARVDKNAAVGSFTRFYHGEIDRYSYIGRNGLFFHTKIGKFCSIADNCVVGGADHPHEWAASSPVFFRGKNVLGKNFAAIEFATYKPTLIGNDVWIGNNVIVKGGIVIGDGAVIGAGSVVTRDVEPYMIVAGNPARLIRKRFDEERIANLQLSRWWDLPDDRIASLAPHICEVDSFIREMDLK